MNDINDFIAQGVSAIVAVPDDSVGICLAAQAKAAGIALVAQHAKFVPNLTIAENVFIGSLPLRAAGFVNWRAVFADAAERLGQFGLCLDVRRRMESTTVAERQMIEIARALFANATVVILDEPTAPLPKHDVAKLFGFVRAQRDRGPRSSISRIASKRFSMWPTG